jgi:GH35 family endo-1,4-beta-xylanase
MLRTMRTCIISYMTSVAVGLAVLPAAAHQDVALKDLMPKGMVIGVAINQRQFDSADAAAVEIITKQFNQISPENVLKFQPTQPGVFLKHRDAVTRVTFWGLSDADAWLNRGRINIRCCGIAGVSRSRRSAQSSRR